MEVLTKTAIGLDIWDEHNPRVLKFEVLLQLMRKVQCIQVHNINVDEEYLRSLLVIFQAINDLEDVKIRRIKVEDFEAGGLQISNSVLTKYQTLFSQLKWTVTWSHSVLTFKPLD